ncbi:MAG TPA: hypothetical protein VI976_03875 [Candidatus Omnitrophota bacterium]|nr:hypothetical protein [Candidatus Omnitrophota bacterium]
MRLKSNKFKARAFSLIEVLITTGILTTAIVFIFRGLTTVLNSAKLSQEMALACFLAEDKLWQIETEEKALPNAPLTGSGREKLQDREFNWSYQITEKDLSGFNKKIRQLELKVSWQEKRGMLAEYSVNTYLAPK